MQLLRRAPDKSWPMLAAGALLAMAIGHALELWLEDLQLFGDVRAGYVHSAQALSFELGVFGLVAAVYFAVRRVLQKRFRDRNDHTLPTLAAIARLGRLRAVTSLLGMQFGALIVVELFEQHLSSYGQPGLAAIFGAGHASAIVVHLIVGAVMGLLVFSFASSVSSQSRVFAAIISTFLRRLLSRVRALSGTAFERLFVPRFIRKQPLLSLGFANRPPPCIAHA